MRNNTNLISGSAMMVVIGVFLFIGPWFGSDGFLIKLGLTIIGLFLVLLGGYFSRG